jgi:hypothetical protein
MPVTLSAQRPVEDVTLPLKGVALCRGSVSRSGKPLARARIRIDESEVFTNREGRFQFELAPGSHEIAAYVVNATGDVLFTFEPIDVLEGTTHDVTFAFDAVATPWRGTLRNAAGPVAKTQVTLSTATGKRTTGASTTTDEKGQFVFSGLAKGRYAARVETVLGDAQEFTVVFDSPSQAIVVP